MRAWVGKTAGSAARRAVLLCCAASAGCSLDPRLTVPPPPVAAGFPGERPVEVAGAASPGWREMFGDPRLQRLIELALVDNRDLRVAARNVESARVQFRAARGAQLPGVAIGAGYVRQRVPGTVVGAGPDLTVPQALPGFEFGQFTAQAALTGFELDLFGRLRSQTEAAFRRYMAVDEGGLAVRIALVSGVADAYLAERLAAEQLALADATLTSWRETLDLTGRLRDAGELSEVDVAAARALVRQAEADRERRRRELALATNALVLLVGVPLPGDLPPPLALADQPIGERLAVGLPSDLLRNRPDIRAAEQALRAANADVGAARAAFFPSISLTSAFGFASLALTNLFRGDSRTWSYGAGVASPLFAGGRLRANLRAAEAEKGAAIARYERAVQVAFREVADGLAGGSTFAREVEAQEGAAAASRDRERLAGLRLAAGTVGRLDLLDAQRGGYLARQALLDATRGRKSSAVGLYRALGGGAVEQAVASGPGGRAGS